MAELKQFIANLYLLRKNQLLSQHAYNQDLAQISLETV